ncbi:glycosyltransferase family 4 protein, partial [Patescibacteria group bacterium]|nr:glycosyltransferase family 4 protein [Patescibacteria group bacterium]
MKIVLDIRKIGKRQTGDETYIVNLVRELSKIDNKNRYYLCTDSYEGKVKAKRLLGKIARNFKFRVLKPAGKLFWTRKALPRFCRKNKVDLVHVQYITPLRLPKGVKLITTIHDVSFKRFPEYVRLKDRLILNWYIPKSIKKADKVIAVSEFTRKEILDAYKRVAKKDKIQVIYNGVDSERFKFLGQYDPGYLERIRSKYNLGGSYIFHTSSLQPRKNVPVLIEAFREYIRRNDDGETILLIGGEGGYNYDKRIDELMCDLVLKNRVRMIGYIKDEDLGAIFSMASLYVSPSIYEGFDLPLLEAMKSGVPVLAARGSCHEEIVGKAGLLADSED